MCQVLRSDRPRALRGRHRPDAPGHLRLVRYRGNAQAWYYSYLAIGLGGIGRLQEGLQVLEDGLASVAKTGEQSNTPVHHFKGELLLAQSASDNAEAERCFRTAIEIARRQSARLAELRATTSLSRLLTKQDRRDEARAMLADIYNWFTEGLDTAAGATRATTKRRMG